MRRGPSVDRGPRHESPSTPGPRLTHWPAPSDQANPRSSQSVVRSSLCRPFLLNHSKHRRMMRLQNLTVAEIHMHATRQTRIEAAHRTHDVDTLEVIRPVLLEDRRVLNRVFVWTRRAVDVARIRVPRSRRIRMVV